MDGLFLGAILRYIFGTRDYIPVVDPLTIAYFLLGVYKSLKVRKGEILNQWSRTYLFFDISTDMKSILP